ncbi:MAG: acetyl-CoA hydrolase/transferase C-terminal domain-containing protein [Bacillota bacterium]|nr:acetyl-CoA hydrolase/transferase C-terminal domain-containing protein [Bacillota bacterium]
MSTWTKQYLQKKVSAEEAVAVIKCGDWVDYGAICGQIRVLDEALAKRSEELEEVKIWSLLTMYQPKVIEADPKGEHFIWHSWHMSGLDRKIASSGRPVYYSSMRYSEIPRYVREHIDPIDVAMMQVGPMDQHGFFNFGPQNSHTRAVCDNARIIIVEVNDKMPRCLGGYEEGIHIDEVDYIVASKNEKLGEVVSGTPSEVDNRVACLIVEEIHDGCCIQLGIGGMPNAVGMMIAESDLKDLGCHTEMMAESYVDMFEAGKMNGKRKQIDPGKMVYAFALGTRRLYDFIDNNPRCATYPVNYTNNPHIAARNDYLITINNAVEIDLYGQVCSESKGTRMISGTGGQLDFVLAGYESKGGKSFVCLPSTKKEPDGRKISKIVPIITPGGIVTDPRSVAHMVVTEYGKFDLKGKTVWQRAEGIINLADPEVRDDLVKAAEKQKIWRKSNK